MSKGFPSGLASNLLLCGVPSEGRPGFVGSARVSCSSCHACSRGLTRAYLAHLCRAKELTYFTLATLHNLVFFQQLMSRIRAAIREQRLAEYVKEIEALFP